MNSSPVSLRRAAEPEVENWDDDEDLHIPMEFRAASAARSRRESASSRMSFQSDGRESFGEMPRDQELVVPEKDMAAAIQAAMRAGIPIPQNTPASALVGGAIKRLGSSRQKRRAQNDDWSDDIELPANGVLKLQNTQHRRVGSSSSSRASTSFSPRNSTFSPGNSTAFSPASTSPLDRFREHPDDGIKGMQTFRFPDSSPQRGLALSPRRLNSSHSSPMKTISMADFERLGSSPPAMTAFSKEDFGRSNISPMKVNNGDDFDGDFEFPEESGELKLRERRRTSFGSDLDDWFEGSLGTRHGAATKSNRSSVASMKSPSITSTFTVDSEDGLDGLQLPEMPINFQEVLKKKKQAVKESPVRAGKDDFFDDFDIGEGEIFDPAKLTLNRNIKAKQTPRTPTRKNSLTQTSVSLTFSNKPSRIPRFHTSAPSQGSILEPVEEYNSSAASDHPKPKEKTARKQRYSEPMANMQPSQLGMQGVNYGSIPPPPPIPASNPRNRTRRLLANPRPEPTTTSSQLLRMKRSMPNIRSSPSSPSRSRPTSRADSQASSRPKTPGSEKGSRIQPSASKSHLISNRSHSRASNENIPPVPARPRSRLSLGKRETPPLSSARKAAVAPDFLRKEAAATKVMTRPAKRRNFGDGTELEAFDDLPTNPKIESHFTVQPVGRGAPKVMRKRSVASEISTPRTESNRSSYIDSGAATPRFARDTNASRLAREQTLEQKASTASQGTNSHWRMQAALRAVASPPGKRKAQQQRPHLIKPLGNAASVSKAVKGMRYNPKTFRWEGNEEAVNNFEPIPVTTPPPRPALITNVGSTKNIQVVGGMVFDPARMCWLKMSQESEDEADPFEGIDDLEEPTADGDANGTGGGSLGEFVVGEEFDVGPQFVRKQRIEEENWKQMVDGWFLNAHDAMDNRRDWELREMILQSTPTSERR